MKPETTGQPETRRQEVSTTDPSAPDDWLVPFAQDDSARRLAAMEDRLRADADLVMRLGLTRYKGPDWEAVAERLAAYGMRVMTAWILNGAVRSKCHEKGWPGPWNEECRDFEVASDLAALTVVRALTKFREVLISGRWSPTGGASLATYYIGQCLLRWANVFQEWSRDERRRIRLPPDGWTPKEPHSDASISDLLNRLTIDELAPKGSDVRAILELRDHGYAWEEIAVVTGRSLGSVRGAVRRLRESVRTNTSAQEAS